MKERTHEETMEICKDVESRYDMDWPDVVLEPLWYGRRPTNRVPERFAIVDQNTGHCYNVCTDAYQPIRHQEVIHLVEQAAKELPEYGKPVFKVQMLHEGGKLNIEVKFPEVEFDINPKVGDIVNPTINVKSSYDLGWKYSGQFGAYRLVCSNGAIVGTIFDSFKKRHLNSLDPMKLSSTINNGMLKFSEQTDLWKSWNEQIINSEVYESLWEALPFSVPEKEKVENLAEAGTGLYLPAALKSGDLTRWMMFNTVTQYATHNIASDIRRIEILPSITRAFESR